MKQIKIRYCALCFFFVSFIFSCDFAEKNIDPNKSSLIEPRALLTYVQLYTSDMELSKRTQIGFCMMMVQQTASLEREEMAGDKYLRTEMTGKYFTSAYTSQIKNIYELIRLTKDDRTLINTYAIALIWKSYAFQKITDLYGDVPYSEAGKGYDAQLFYPRYDSQHEIYQGLINDITLGLSLFDESMALAQGDIIYNGDIAKWKKFANSLLLRVGMRLEKVDPTLAAKTVKKALNGGVMDEVTDVCMTPHQTGKNAIENPLGRVFIAHGLLQSGSIKISRRFIDYLKATKDPRLGVYCSLPDGRSDTTLQKGLPNGYDILSIYQGDPTYTSLADYSTLNTKTLLALDAPTIHMTHAETCLLLAEAVLKQWIEGDAKAYYEQAVISSMQQQSVVYHNIDAISQDQIDLYLSQDRYEKAVSTDLKLELLGSEFWVASFLNGIESYAHWRRTGYPILIPTFYNGSQDKGAIPRRLTYPTEEYSINKEKLQEALDRQGVDAYKTRVWWDIKQ